jgi:predicted polyphosphate/ATP-dependent NAD kinase
MTYYKYMVYGDIPLDQDPPSWTFDEIMKRKGGIMNFVQGGVKRKAAAAASSVDERPNEQLQVEAELKAAAAVPTCNPLQATSKGQTSKWSSDIQQYISSQQDTDETVFKSLPTEIQHELVTQWKLQNETLSNEQTTERDMIAENAKKPKLRGGKGTLDSFFAKK